MKKFDQENGNDYPTFSLCFKGTKFHWYHEWEIFNSYQLNATQYELMLKGKHATRYDRNDLMRSYSKTPVFLNDGRDVDFRSFHLQAKDFIQSINFIGESSLKRKNNADKMQWIDPDNEQLYLYLITSRWPLCLFRMWSNLIQR